MTSESETQQGLFPHGCILSSFDLTNHFDKINIV